MVSSSAGSAASAEAALDLLPWTDAQLALIDLSLPGMNGIEPIRELQQRSPHLLCVVLSGHKSTIYSDDARNAGARAYVEKSEAAHLVGVLRHVLTGGTRFRA